MAESPHEATLTSVFSYFDTACGCVYFHLTVQAQSELDQQIRDALAELDRARRVERLRGIAADILERDYAGTLAHEWHHSLQQIFYPFQYLQSWREFHIALDVLGALRHREYVGPIFAGRIELREPDRNTIVSSTMVWRFKVDDRRLVLVPSDPQVVGRFDFTQVELIEEATSIFQYKMQIGAEGDARGYNRWLRLQPVTYSNLYRLMAQLLGDEAAYIALPALVQAAFSTTWPAHVFRDLFNLTVGSDTLVPDVIGIDLYYDLLKRRLAINLPEEMVNVSGPTDEDQLSYLSPKIYQSIVTATPLHPAYPLARKYEDLTQQSLDFDKALFHPYRTDVLRRLRADFLPSVTMLRLHHPLLHARETVAIVNPTIEAIAFPELPEMTYKDYLMEAIKRKDIAYSLFSDINDRLEHNCHHEICPYHKTNVCRRWSAIPASWEKCPFPDWFQTATGHALDPSSNRLVPLAELGGDRDE